MKCLHTAIASINPLPILGSKIGVINIKEVDLSKDKLCKMLIIWNCWYCEQQVSVHSNKDLFYISTCSLIDHCMQSNISGFLRVTKFAKLGKML